MPIAVKNRWSVPPAGRSALVSGTYKPGADTTGILADVPLTPVLSSVTLSTPGQIYENMDVFGRLSITAANVTVRNCRIRGTSTPNSSGLVTCTNTGCVNAYFEDCEIRPDFPHYSWNGVVGHDFTLMRCNVYGTTDIINIHNTNLAPNAYNTGVVIQQSWLHDMVWWTAASGGVVHPSDTETHNDVIQHYGGSGTIIRGNYIDGQYSRQAGHWQVIDPNSEPYTTIPLHSLSDGGPYQAIPDRGTGTATTGRYNWDDDSCLMLNNTQGKTNQLTVEDNFFRAGNYCVNGGGNPYNNDGISLGTFYRNKFSRDQGTQGSGGNTTYTLVFFGNWAGHVDAPTVGANANVYEDDGAAIQVRP